jgi:hypothetical protein
MEKFKVGDVIRCIDDQGVTAVILEVTPTEYIYDLYQDGFWYAKHDGCFSEIVELDFRKVTKLELAMK